MTNWTIGPVEQSAPVPPNPQPPQLGADVVIQLRSGGPAKSVKLHIRQKPTGVVDVTTDKGTSVKVVTV